MTKRKPAEVFPPGHFIKEEMDARGWSLDQLSTRSHMTTDLLTALIEGQLPITRGVAVGLARAFSTSAEYWLNLERAWREEDNT